MRAIFNKELRAYFTSAAGYIFMGFFLFISGIFFALSNILTGNPNFNSVLGSITFVFLIVVPALTMGLLSQETKQKTDQLLLTSPLKVLDIVVGKYVSALALFFLTLLVTMLFPVMLSFFGEISWAEIMGGYIGFFLLGSSFIAIGLFISALTENQTTAAVGTFGALLLLWIMDWVIQGLPTGRVASIVFVGILVLVVGLLLYYMLKNLYISIGVTVLGWIMMAAVYFMKKELYDGFILKFFRWFSLLQRQESFSMGVFDISEVIYYISFSFVFIFLTIRVIEKRRWS